LLLLAGKLAILPAGGKRGLLDCTVILDQKPWLDSLPP
jgi:hypothetical protein